MSRGLANRLARLEQSIGKKNPFENWVHVRQTEIEAFKAWWPVHNPEIPLSALTIVTDSMPPKDDAPEPPWGWGDTLKKWPRSSDA